MIDARIAIASSIAIGRVKEVYSPLRSLITPGTRTKSTRERKSKLPMIGDPDRMRTESSSFSSHIAWAMVRHRRK
jgi:hypothetical protein